MEDRGPEAASLGPVTAGERIESIDVLRGFALLGILVINIEFFALPSGVYFDARLAGGLTGIHLLTWQFSSTFFLQKMMGIFSMLFGAGVIILTGRAKGAGRSAAGPYYRRTLWLLVIALIHGYLVWYGDILFSYAMIGWVLYLFRNRRPSTLLILAFVALLLGSLLQWGTGLSLRLLEQAVADPQISNEVLVDRWEDLQSTFAPSAEDVATEVEAYRGGYVDNLEFRIPKTIVMQTNGFFYFTLWRAAGMMLLGMGLMKLGVFSARRSARGYAVMMAVGLFLGLPLCYLALRGLRAHDFDFIHRFMVDNQFNYWGSVLVALGYIGAVMLVCQKGLMRGLTRRLAAVGRMALTNYLFHSIVCTSLFYGFGFGLYSRVERFWLFLIVLAIWTVQLLLSPVWLRRYRFGPAEWLWRTLTYGRRQPMRVPTQHGLS